MPTLAGHVQDAPLAVVELAEEEGDAERQEGDVGRAQQQQPPLGLEQREHLLEECLRLAQVLDDVEGDAEVELAAAVGERPLEVHPQGDGGAGPVGGLEVDGDVASDRFGERVAEVAVARSWIHRSRRGRRIVGGS